MKAKLFFSALALWVTGATVFAQEQYEKDALYVRFKQTATPKPAGASRMAAIKNFAALQNRQARYGLHQEMISMRTFENAALACTFALRFDSLKKIDELMADLQADPRVELVEKIPVYHLQGAMGSPVKADDKDPLYETEYGSWHLKLIHAEEAWAKQSGSADIKVAVVDNAVWGNHPDLNIASENQHNIASGESGSSAPPSNISQDPDCASHTGCVPYNWSHGTHCAGAVAAVRNNGIGIAGIGSGVTLMSVSCPGTDPSGLAMRNGFQGVVYAAEKGAKVISMSWGNYTIAETERAIIQTCIDKGIVMVAAAGNNSYKDKPMYPAYLPGVISVASVNSDRRISSFSNYGEWVTVAAPGGFVVSGGNESKTSILSTTYCTSQNYRLNGHPELAGQHYDGMYGTSMATPVVSGLCGLLLSANKDLSPYLMREILMTSAQELIDDNKKGICAASGVIDAAAALRLLEKNIARPQNLQAVRVQRQIELSWEKPATDKAVAKYQIFCNDSLMGQTEASQTKTSMAITKMETLYRLGVRVLYADGDTSLKTCLDVRVPLLYELKASVQPENCGKVEGEGFSPARDTVRLVARAVKGCQFVRWTEEGKILGRDSVLDVFLDRNMQLRAMFSGSPEIHNQVFENASSLRLYPNPTSGVLTVESETDVYAVEVYASNGRRVLAKHFPQGGRIQRLDLSDLPSGVYLIETRSTQGRQTEKISKR